MNFISKTITVAGFATLSVAANATITPIGQFTGALSESFESFQNYLVNPLFYEPEPFVVMGGAASFVSSVQLLTIWEPSDFATWGLIDSGSAVPADGLKGMGLDTTGENWTLTFASDQNDFGAFWGVSTEGAPGTATVEFFDATNTLVGSTSFSYDHETNADGILDWNGWNSDIAFRSVRVSGNYVAIDAMQAGSAVPEPATMSVLALGALAMLRRRKTAK
ncbi:MAG TPA: PEP-CTERM sorting domain-containing protein [Fimbriimonas sp.]|nr:PEP-CTERM sorting domain-containing protein [Fimbriimonas sp.]